MATRRLGRGNVTGMILSFMKGPTGVADSIGRIKKSHNGLDFQEWERKGTVDKLYTECKWLRLKSHLFSK